MQNEALFRDKPVWSAIFSMAIPSVFTILVMIVYNMADMFFIGRLGDTAQVGAISIVGPVFSLLSAVSTMIGVGGCATIAKALGGGQTENARTCASLCGWTFLLFGVVFAAAALVFTDPLLRMLGATPDMWHYAGSYMRILALGAPVMLFSQGMAMLIRSEGAIKEGLIGNLSGTVVNLILDPVFILGLKWGVAGAAAATVLGNLVGSVYFVCYILRKSGILNLKPQCALRSPGSLLPMMALGLPNALSSILSGLASTFSNRLLSAYGTSAIAAMGAAGKITMLVGLVQMGICMGVQPMMAYNYGAGNLARLKEILLNRSARGVCGRCHNRRVQPCQTHPDWAFPAAAGSRGHGREDRGISASCGAGIGPLLSKREFPSGRGKRAIGNRSLRPAPGSCPDPPAVSDGIFFWLCRYRLGPYGQRRDFRPHWPACLSVAIWQAENTAAFSRSAWFCCNKMNCRSRNQPGSIMLWIRAETDWEIF